MLPRVPFLLAWITSAAFQFLSQTAHGAESRPVQTIQIATRDGIQLATDIHLPVGDGPFATILARTPYNKASATSFGRDGSRRGFAVVIQDTRGRFASTGENLPFHLDGPDGADTLDWIRRQPWSNGRIGTWGGSAGAITQFQLAGLGHPPVDAQFLVVGAPNLHEVVYTGGVFRKSLVEDWIRVTRFATNALPIWVSHPVYDDYWKQRDATRHFPRTRAAGIHIGGWWDIFAQATLDGFVGYQTRGAPQARGRQKLIMGPWTHGVLSDKAGQLAFPNAKNPPGETEDAWRWFEHTLLDVENGADRDPAVRYYVLGDITDPAAPGNAWRSADAWPPFQIQPTRFFLRPDRSLSRTPPPRGESGSLAYTYEPADPVPTLGGIQLTIPAGPMDQRDVESRDDVLVFSSEVIENPVEVTGRVRARLWVTSDAPDTDFLVRLCDVYPDGRSFNLCEGILRARFRSGVHRERFLQPGQPTRIDVDLWSTSIVFNRGHRIRVHVTSSSNPGFDPNPNTGSPFRSDTETRAARNAVVIDARHPSHLLLPVVP
ncbi:MAG: CocE/NonD family hydrolase [Limisphaerales bacterium]